MKSIVMAMGLTALAAASALWAEPKPSPLDARVQVAPLVHRSALHLFRRAGAQAPQPIAWREANDQVERIGGWRSYLREAQMPDAPDSPDAPASAPAATHKHH
jgi:hypothetical protein